MIADISPATTKLEDSEKYHSWSKGHCHPQSHNKNIREGKGQETSALGTMDEVTPVNLSTKTQNRTH